MSVCGLLDFRGTEMSLDSLSLLSVLTFFSLFIPVSL